MPIIGVIAKLTGTSSITSVLTAMVTMICTAFALNNAAYAFKLVSLSFFHGEQLVVDSIGGELSSAVNGSLGFAKHTCLASFQFDPGGLLEFLKSCRQERPMEINTVSPLLYIFCSQCLLVGTTKKMDNFLGHAY